MYNMDGNIGPNTGRSADGTFAPGNPGKPKGARHRSTLAAQALLDGESEALTRKAVSMALEGDVTALRLCLERITPPRRDTPVTFDLPVMRSLRDAASAAAAIIAAVAAGDLTPTEGTHVMALIDSFRRTLEVTEIEERIANLERARNEKHSPSY